MIVSPQPFADERHMIEQAAKKTCDLCCGDGRELIARKIAVTFEPHGDNIAFRILLLGRARTSELRVNGGDRQHEEKHHQPGTPRGDPGANIVSRVGLFSCAGLLSCGGLQSIGELELGAIAASNMPWQSSVAKITDELPQKRNAVAPGIGGNGAS